MYFFDKIEVFFVVVVFGDFDVYWFFWGILFVIKDNIDMVGKLIMVVCLVYEY